MKKFSFLGLSMLLLSVVFSANAADYGLPANIQDGNILHCFDWSCAQVQEELDNIANAGFGAVQLSPLQGSANSGAEWYYCYLPYDFKLVANGIGNKTSLTSLCAAAHERGIKVIVDVVANHVNGSSSHRDSWWNSNGRLRYNGGIDYSNRYSITHGQLGDYGDANSEDSEVQARAKAYVEELKACGVDGIRWDAAKHIGLPSEGCNFWSTVTSVSGMWHYGEILDSPGGDGNAVMKEYTTYMSVTDNGYSSGVRNSVNGGGVPSGYAGWAASTIADSKVVYWAESHDDYSNEWQASTHVSQAVIDRAWAIIACRNGASSLYFSRPSATSKDAIKVGVKGSTNFKSNHIAAVNKLRNKAVGAADYFTSSNGVVSVTRKGVGATIVKGSGSGSVSIANGGGYCPAGTYIDQVSGGTFTVTASTISGNVGSSGIAVLVIDGEAPEIDDNTGDDNGNSGNTGNYPSQLYLIGTVNSWGTSTSIAADNVSSGVYTWNSVNLTKASDADGSFFSFVTVQGSDWDAVNASDRYGAASNNATISTSASITKFAANVNASAAYSWLAPAGTYKVVANLSTMTVTLSSAGSSEDTDDNTGNDNVVTDGVTITGDYNIAYSGNHTHVHYWGGASASTWPGVAFVSAKGSDGNTYKVAKVASGTTGIVFNTNGSTQTGDLTYSGSYIMNDNGATSTKVVFSNGDTPVNPDPDPVSGYTVYFDNSGSNWSTVYCYAWTTGESDQNGAWPGVAMTALGNNIYSYTSTTEPANVIFNNGSTQTDDLAWVTGHIYKADGSHSEYQDNTEVAPTVTISPNGGTVKGTSNITVTIAGEPTSITADFNGTAVTLANGSNTIAVSSYLNDGQTGTLTISATNAYGSTTAEATFTRSDESTPTPTPTGNSLNTDYYKTNPNGQVGTRKTINMSFNNQNATNALSNWSDAELIAQGVARDVSQAMKGNHERPIIDSYAIYAAYDSENLYLGVQFVYTVWDLYGEGKQPGESKPYNMDGRLMIAFDLDPDKSFDGYINGTGAIWNDEGTPGAKFNNGVDAVWIGSTKPGVGTPGFFIPTADGHASYDAAYCKTSTVTYGYADGLASCISNIYGQDSFNYDASVLETNNGFTDLSGEVDASAHTFYEFKIPLSLLGITESHITNTGIGVQYLDIYGSSPVGGTPYDPVFFDNVTNNYSMDPSSSQEKEDEDVLTYSLARIGKTALSGITDVVGNGDESLNIYAIDGVLYIDAEEDAIVTIVSADGRMIQQEVSAGRNVIDDLNRGFYIVNRTKVIL